MNEVKIADRGEPKQDSELNFSTVMAGSRQALAQSSVHITHDLE